MKQSSNYIKVTFFFLLYNIDSLFYRGEFCYLAIAIYSLLFPDIAFPCIRRYLLFQQLHTFHPSFHPVPFFRRSVERGLKKTASSKNGSGWPCVKQHIPYVTPGLISPLIYATAKRPNRRSWNPVNADHYCSWRFRWRISAVRSPFCLAGSRGCKCHWRHSVARGFESLD